LPGLSVNPELPGTQNGYWMPTVVFDKSTGLTSERITKSFLTQNIDARVFFHPLSTTPPFEGSPSGRWASDIADRAINLPSFHDITDIEQSRIVEVVREICNA
jgi:perosamine synthetase